MFADSVVIPWVFLVWAILSPKSVRMFDFRFSCNSNLLFNVLKKLFIFYVRFSRSSYDLFKLIL